MNLRLCCVVVALMLVAGCARLGIKDNGPAPVSTPSMIPPTTTDGNLLVYAQRFDELSAEEQKREITLVTQALNRNKSDIHNRMKAALIYGLPTSRYRDNERSTALLDELQHDMRADTDIRALAAVLKDYVAERQRLESNAAKAGQKAADEQKRADTEQKRADTEQKRADGLQQKLDELKNIDKAMSERYQTRPK